MCSLSSVTGTKVFRTTSIFHWRREFSRLIFQRTVFWKTTYLMYKTIEEPLKRGLHRCTPAKPGLRSQLNLSFLPRNIKRWKNDLTCDGGPPLLGMELTRVYGVFLKRFIFAVRIRGWTYTKGWQFKVICHCGISILQFQTRKVISWQELLPSYSHISMFWSLILRLPKPALETKCFYQK